MTWTEKADGKWSSDLGYAIRQREDGWQLFDPHGIAVGIARPTFEEAKARADEHADQVYGG